MRCVLVGCMAVGKKCRRRDVGAWTIFCFLDMGQKMVMERSRRLMYKVALWGEWPFAHKGHSSMSVAEE